MYERFTDRARKVMQLATQEAQRYNHEYIGTEHILLGLLKETGGLAANVLRILQVSVTSLQTDMQALLQSGSTVVKMAKLPQTARAKKVLEHAMAESRLFNAGHVGTEHILLGLVQEEEGIAAMVLNNHGVTLEKCRQEVARLSGLNFGKPAGEIPEKPEEKMWTIEISQPAPAAVENVITMSLENTQQRDRSGSIDDPRPLVSFLYELMRDHLPTGVVEHVARNSTGVSGTKFCNGWLALYAQDVANRLLAGPPPVELVPKADEPKPAPTAAAEAPQPE